MMKEVSRAKWIWCCMMMVVMMMVMPSSSHSSSSTVEEAGISKHLGYNKVTFDVDKMEDYRVFITQLRNALAAKQKTCEIQTTESNPGKGAEYLWVELKAGAKVVTLGIDVKDGYVLGYQDMYKGKYRANVLKSDDGKNDFIVEPKTLFPQAKEEKRSTGFNGQYGTLESKSGSSRKSIQLSFIGLSSDIQTIYGKDPKAIKMKDEARFFLRAIQFVSEAARFKFIEDAIASATQVEPVGAFRDKLIAYVTSWDKISQAIHNANKCGAFPKPLTINGKVLNKVEDVKGDMGLLKHKKLRTTAAVTSIPLADVAAQEYLLEFA